MHVPEFVPPRRVRERQPLHERGQGAVRSRRQHREPMIGSATADLRHDAVAPPRHGHGLLLLNKHGIEYDERFVFDESRAESKWARAEL